MMSVSTAKKYFGEDDPIGKVITMNKTREMTVRGVFNDPPPNTDLPFDMFIYFDETARKDYDNWGWGNRSSAVQCYVLLKPGTDLEDLAFRITEIYHKNRPEDPNSQYEVFLQPLSTLHSDDRFTFTYGRFFSEQSLIGLTAIGIFLLLTACINFINLNTVLVTKRTREVGIRKVLGSKKVQLVTQFLGETALVTGASFLISFGVIELVFIHIDKLLGYSLDVNWLNPGPVIFILAVFLLVVVFSGLYPAYVMSSFSPVRAIKNNLNTSYNKGLSLRRALVILQFVISVVLIISTLIVVKQMDYLLNAPVGFTKESIVEVPIPIRDKSKLEFFKQELLKESAISSVSYSNTGTMNSNTWGGTYTITMDEKELEERAQIKFVDQDYFDTYEIDFLAGEGLTPSDTANKIVVNQELINRVGIDDPDEVLGRNLEMWGREAPIVGVVKNFNTTSLHQEVVPVVMMPELKNFIMAAIKVSSPSYQEPLDIIKATWEKVFPEQIYSFRFLDDSIRGYYEDEERTSALFQIFAIISIFIGCIGLFGLVSFMTTQRIKEIGIRKALGASISDIVKLFSREFVGLLLVAFMIGMPLAYYFMAGWLSDFAYRIDLTPWIFLVGIAVTFLIAISTVGYKSFKAAVANPADSLRDE